MSCFAFPPEPPISIHTLRMEGDLRGHLHRDGVLYISIHTLRMEGDPTYTTWSGSAWEISIHTLRMEGDWWAPSLTWMNAISIHTLRMEGDCVRAARLSDLVDFNPHPPHGG